MRNPYFETCPLRVELDTALVEKLLETTRSAIRMQHEDLTPSKEEVDRMTANDEAQAWKDHHLVEERMAATCVGVQATGKCCLVDLCRDEIEYRFSQSAPENYNE